jgi:F-type H+-transporting ATPase subunit delta
MKISKQARRDAKELFRATFANGVMDTAKVRQVVQQVLAAKPRGYVGILEHFKRLVKLEEARRAARIESPVALEPAQQERLTSNLARIYGPGLNISFQQNASLIGGLRVKVGSNVYDSSVAARLQQLEESF